MVDGRKEVGDAVVFLAFGVTKNFVAFLQF